MAERSSEVTELKRNLAQALQDKEQLQEVKRQRFGTLQLKKCHLFFKVDVRLQL